MTWEDSDEITLGFTLAHARRQQLDAEAQRVRRQLRLIAAHCNAVRANRFALGREPQSARFGGMR